MSSGSSIFAKERSCKIFPVSSSTQIVSQFHQSGNRFDLGILDAFPLFLDLLRRRCGRNRVVSQIRPSLNTGEDHPTPGIPVSQATSFVEIPFGGRLGGLWGFTRVRRTAKLRPVFIGEGSHDSPNGANEIRSKTAIETTIGKWIMDNSEVKLWTKRA